MLELNKSAPADIEEERIHGTANVTLTGDLQQKLQQILAKFDQATSSTTQTNLTTYTTKNGDTYAIMNLEQFTDFMTQFQNLAKRIPKAIKDIRPTANIT